MALENKIKNEIICEKQTMYSSSFEKTKEISSTTSSSSTSVHSTSHSHHQIKTIPFKIFEEEVWFSGSELKTDNSSSDEDFKDKKNLTKKLTKSTSSVLPTSSSTSSSSVDFIKKGAKKKISKTILSSSSSSTKNRYTKTRMQQITINKQSTATSSSSPSVSSKKILETSKSSMSTNLLKPSIETEVPDVAITVPVTNDNPEDSLSPSATKIIITDESTYEMDTGGEEHGATAISSTASETLTSNVQWRPKRGSVSLPGLITELEQIQI